jgi:Tol biopolymer transport system component
MKGKPITAEQMRPKPRGAQVVLMMVLGGMLIGCPNLSEAGRGETARCRRLPERARILFTSNQDTGTERSEIYAMDAEGDNITRITRSNHHHFVLGTDRTRRYVVATRGTEKNKQVWLLDLKTGKERPLTDAGNHAEGRSFSPDGQWIVFWMVVAGKTHSDIYKVRRDGTDLTNLTNTPQAHEFDPSWSNAGDAIAYSFNDGHPNRFVLNLMDSGGGNVRTIYDPHDSVATAIFPAGVYDPAWGPDDEWLVVEKPVQFTGTGENGRAGVWRILKVRADGSEVLDLTAAGPHRGSAVYAPSVSPDGTAVLFICRYGPKDPSGVSLNIFKMASDGGRLEPLTETPYWEQFAVWIR